MPILLWFIESKLGRTVALTGLIIIGVGMGWLIFSTHYYNKGWAAAIHAVAAQDQRAVNAAHKAIETVKTCRDSGHQWNVADGVCE